MTDRSHRAYTLCFFIAPFQGSQSFTWAMYEVHGKPGKCTGWHDFLLMFKLYNIHLPNQTMGVTLNNPYITLPNKRLKYITHYGITAEDFLIVPLKDYGSDVSCEVRWEDENGLMQVRQHIVFNKQNLMKLNGLLIVKLQEIWNHYYSHPATAQPSISL
jgi:hypothetical protein